MRLTLSSIAVAAVLAFCASTLSAQSPPYGGYTNPSHSYLSGYGFHIESYQLKLGSSTLQQNLNSGGTTSPCYHDYTALTPANLVPGSSHTVIITFGTGSYTYPMGASVWIDYNNNGSFTDSGERVCFMSSTVNQPGPGTMTFTPPTGVGGVRRLRVVSNYYSVPTSPIGSQTYGETEDYLVNLGFAIATQSPLPAGAQGTPYQTDIVAVNGTAPYTWQYSGQGYIKSGSLPPNLTASTTGSPAMLHISGNPGTPGTYTFTVEVTDNAAKTSTKTFQITIFPPSAALPFSDDFTTDKGWQLLGQWQRGTPVAFTSTAPPRTEPGQDHTQNGSNKVMGHKLGGDYANSMSSTEWATSPPFDCSTGNPQYVRLRFWSWTGFSPGDSGVIEISNNGGSSWVNVWSAPSGGTFQQNAWTSMFVDISSQAVGNGVVQVRFGVGPTDSSISNVGWTIDDLLVEVPGYDLKVQETGSTGTQFYDNDPAVGGRNFGTIAVSTQSAPLTVYITNLGPTNVVFTPTISKTGANPTDFYLNTSALVNPLPPNQSTSFTITFYRTTVGTSTATINVFHNAAYSGTSPFEINVTGNAIVPQPIIRVNLGSATGPQISHQQSPAGTPRDFGNRDIGAGPSGDITIFVTNAGTGTLAVSTPDMGGTWWTEYNVNSAGMTSSLTAGQSTSFKVNFDPGSIGQKDAYVRIAHTDGTQATPFYVPVTGNGTSSGGPTIGVHEGTVTGPTLASSDPAAGARDFGSVLVGNTSAPCTITIENVGGAAMTLATPTLGGTNPGEFSLVTTGFQTSLTPGTSTSFTVAFAPTSVGVKLAQVTFTHNDTAATNPFVVNFKGNGVTTVAAIEVRETNATGNLLTNPAPATGILDFGTQDVNAGATGVSTIYVENVGTAPLTVGLPSFQAPQTEFQLQTTGFAGTIAPGASATFGILFDPTVAGTHTAVVQFTHNDTTAGTPFILNLTGDAVLNAPIIEVREGTTIGTLIPSGASAVGTGRDCGTIDVSAANTFPSIIVIMNTGNQTLNLGTPTLTGVNAADFILNVGGMSTTVAPGASTQFDVTFDPVLAGMKDCQVEFTQDDPGNADPYIVKFVGTGTDPNAVQITTPILPGAIPSVQYGPMAMDAIQGTTPYVWSIYSGNLPAGVGLTSNGILSGTPSGFGGVYAVTIRVADATGATNEKTYNIVLSGNLSGRGKAKDNGCAASDSGSNLTLALLAALGMLACGARFIRRRA
ncbi:MAG: choice-of-anchor D domain-containing protein [Planctomycetes bacterium]|nr:choice-of-anchor D domain-containing protein [Planctomycetota bacterium]